MGSSRRGNPAEEKTQISVMQSFGIEKPALYVAWKDYMSCRQVGMSAKEALRHTGNSMPKDALEVFACFGLELFSELMEERLSVE